MAYITSKYYIKIDIFYEISKLYMLFFQIKAQKNSTRMQKKYHSNAILLLIEREK